MERNDQGQFIKGGIPWDKDKKRPEIKKWLTPFIWKKGQIPWNKGKKCPYVIRLNRKRIYTKEIRERMRAKKLGRKFPKLSEARKGSKNPFYGKRHSINTREKIGYASKGEKHWNWKGGITPESQERLHTIEWDIVRKSILKRDKYHCRECGTKEKLDVHHKRPWRISKEDNPNDLISLCRKCHMKTERLMKF